LRKKELSLKEKYRLHYTTTQLLCQWFNLSDAVIEVFSWFIIGILFAKTVTLSKIAAKIPGQTKLPSRTQRLWRWLSNPKVVVQFLAEEVAKRWLANFRNTTVYLVIDRTDISNTHWLLFVGIAYRGRTVPLIWQVLSNRGSTSFRQQAKLLKLIVPMIDNSCKVVLLGDREFRSTALMNFCKRQGWHFRLRLKCDTWIRANRRWFQLRDLNIERGESLFFTKVYITKNRRGPYHLACCWLDGDEPWYIATDESPTAKTFFEFDKRFYVEAMFSDFKKRGLNLEDTRIQTPQRINRLMLIVVIAYLFLIQQGMRCVRDGKRRFFEKSRRRFYSLARLGSLHFEHRFDGGEVVQFALPRLC